MARFEVAVGVGGLGHRTGRCCRTASARRSRPGCTAATPGRRRPAPRRGPCPGRCSTICSRCTRTGRSMPSGASSADRPRPGRHHDGAGRDGRSRRPAARRSPGRRRPASGHRRPLPDPHPGAAARRRRRPARSGRRRRTRRAAPSAKAAKSSRSADGPQLARPRRGRSPRCRTPSARWLARLARAGRRRSPGRRRRRSRSGGSRRPSPSTSAACSKTSSPASAMAASDETP